MQNIDLNKLQEQEKIQKIQKEAPHANTLTDTDDEKNFTLKCETTSIHF